MQNQLKTPAQPL